jgi:hypothetical protein
MVSTVNGYNYSLPDVNPRAITNTSMSSPLSLGTNFIRFSYSFKFFHGCQPERRVCDIICKRGPIANDTEQVNGAGGSEFPEPGKYTLEIGFICVVVVVMLLF